MKMGGAWRVPVLRWAVSEMLQAPSDDVGLGDKGDDAHFSAAVLAGQGVGFENPSDKMCPPPAKGRVGIAWVGALGGFL